MSRESAIRRAVRLFTVALLLVVMALPAFGGGRPLSASLSGDQEVPDSGSEATGTARFTLNQGLGEICVVIESDGYEEGEMIVAGHIHDGVAGVNGPIEVDLFVESADHSVCVDVDKAIVKDIRQNPDDYYINLHSNFTPSGVIRGQLTK